MDLTPWLSPSGYAVFYFHLQCWCSQHGLVKSDSFVPAVPLELLPDAQRCKAQKLLHELLEVRSVNDRTEFQNMVAERLTSVLQILPRSFIVHSKDSLIDSFFQDEYYAIFV